MNWEEGYQKVLEKATNDNTYRARLLQTPKDAIKEVVGPTLPAGIEFVVNESTPTKQYFVLPPAKSAELSDVELEQVAGGKGGPICFLRWPIPFGPKPFTFC